MQHIALDTVHSVTPSVCVVTVPLCSVLLSCLAILGLYITFIQLAYCDKPGTYDRNQRITATGV